MGNIFAEIPPPAHWQDFELLTLEICRKKWLDDYAELNGRQGQDQAGVDIYGYNQQNHERTGVQCKKRKIKLNGIISPSSLLTTDEIDKELADTKTFKVLLDRYIVATTGPRDNLLQEHVRKLNSPNTKPIITLWF